jgi:hypothetical protein
MSQFVVMPKEDWTAALDSLRGQTHSSEGIKSGELAGIIDGLASLGVSAHFTAFAHGTVTPASNVTAKNTLTIEHGLGVEPNFFLFFADDFANAGSTQQVNLEVAAIMPIDKSTSSLGGFIVGYGNNSVTAVDLLPVKKTGAGDYNQYTDLWEHEVFSTTAVIAYAAAARVITAGRTYHWLCGVMDNDN